MEIKTANKELLVETKVQINDSNLTGKKNLIDLRIVHFNEQSITHKT